MAARRDTAERPLVAIVGATATGKTQLAVALGQRFAGEVINADSRQVYRYMDIGTAKPTAEERAAVPHHLVDIVNPDQPFSLAEWLSLARAALEDVWTRGRLPLLVGGTGQYVWALLEGWTVPRVPPQPELRRQLLERAAREGGHVLFQELQARDPEAARFIDPRNLRRVARALEVLYVTGEPFSRARRKEPPPFRALVLGLWLPRHELYRSIDERVERMVREGLVEEVRRLLAMGYGRHLPAMSGIGYKEVAQYLAGEMDLATAVARIKTETHRLVRHQEDWFRRDDRRIRWLRADVPDLIDEAAWLLRTELGLQEWAPARGPMGQG